MEKKQKREGKKARREAKKEAKKARWEILVADLGHAKKENERLGFVLEKLRSVMALPTCASSELLHDIDTILNAEPEEPSSEEEAGKEVSDEEIEKIVENWDNEELVRVFWLFVNDQGIESDFMDYARNVARVEL